MASVTADIPFRLRLSRVKPIFSREFMLFISHAELKLDSIASTLSFRLIVQREMLRLKMCGVVREEA